MLAGEYTCIITSKLVNQCAPKALFTCVIYTNITIVYVRRHKYVLGPTQTHFSSTLEGIEEIKTEKKMTTKHSKNIFFTNAVRKRQQTLTWLLDFDWLLRSYDYLILIFYWFISAG